MPSFPDEDRIHEVSVKQLMRRVVPWVNQAMPEYLCENGVITDKAPMNQHLPLEIQSTGDVVSYKEVWHPERCAQSLRQTNLYEAGGNLCWVDPAVVQSSLGPEESIPVEDPSYTWLRDYAKTAFQVEKLTTDNGNAYERIRFPAALDTYLGTPPGDKEYPKQIFLMAGHALVWAWYHASWHALSTQSCQEVKLLYECALCTTVCIRVCNDLREIAEVSVKSSKRVRQEAEVLVDTFLTFGKKVALMSTGKPNLKELVAKGMRFDGALVNSSMIQTIDKFSSVFTPETAGIVGQIDRSFGSKVFSGKYNKVRLLLQGCKNDPENVRWCLESILVGLQRGEIAADDLTLDAFRNDACVGTPSATRMTVQCRTVVQHIGNIIANLGHVNA